MRKKHYALVICLLLAATLAALYLHRKVAATSPSPSTVQEEIDTVAVDTIIISMQEPYTFGTEISRGMKEPVELMPLFDVDDSFDSMAERGWALYHTLIKDYEKHLIRKYAPLNLTTGDEILERQRALESPRPMTSEELWDMRRKQNELTDFGSAWGRIMREGSLHPPWNFRIDPPQTPETLWAFWEEDIFLRLKDMEGIVNYERRHGHDTRAEEKNATKFNDRQMELLNQFIITHKIPAKAPGLPFTKSVQLSDEDKAFVEDAVKGNPAVKLPWRD